MASISCPFLSPPARDLSVIDPAMDWFDTSHLTSPAPAHGAFSAAAIVTEVAIQGQAESAITTNITVPATPMQVSKDKDTLVATSVATKAQLHEKVAVDKLFAGNPAMLSATKVLLGDCT